MTREQNHIIKKLKSLSPDEIARVQQFLDQLKSPGSGAGHGTDAVTEAATAAAPAAGTRAAGHGAGSPPARPDAATEAANPDAEVAQAAGAVWRRRPFQSVDAEDLQPIAALFREALDCRAASRFRYGSR